MNIFGPSGLQLSDTEKRTFRLHTFHMFIEGIIDGSLVLNEFILIKSLFGSDYQLGMLFQFSVIVLLFSVVFNELIKRTVRKRKLLLIAAFFTRLPLALFIFFPSQRFLVESNPVYPLVFLLIFLFYYIYKPVILPTINLFLRTNYSPDHFGRLYSYSTLIKKIVVIVSTFLFGWLLDFNHYAFVYVYPVLAVMGIFSVYLLTRMDYQPLVHHNQSKNLVDSVKRSFREMGSIIRVNKPYRDFEIGFMFYGFAWMATSAVITIYLEKSLHLSYSSVAFYKNFSNILAIVMLPYFGKLIGKIDPRKFGVYTFGSLLFHLLFIILTQMISSHHQFLGIEIYWMLVISFFFNGIFTATMALLWGIGSSYFCKTEDAGNYQGVHLTLVGFRGLFAPLVGVFIFELMGYSGALGAGVLSLAVAISVLYWSMRKRKHSG